MKISAFLIALLLIMLLPCTLFGYDNKVTHPDITKKAISDFSNLNIYLKTSLGFAKGLDTYLSSSSINSNLTILKLIAQGSNEEDVPNCRAANHFHNPLLPWDESYMNDDITPLGIAIREYCEYKKGWKYTDRKSALTWATGYISLSPSPDGTKISFNQDANHSPNNWDKENIS